MFAAVLFLGLGVVAGVNYLGDPFGVYRPRATAELERFRSYEFRRIQVGEVLWQQRPEVLLLGSSRAFVGVDPRWPEWGGRAANAGVPSATMAELEAIARFATERGVRRIFLFADFFAFNDSVVSHRDFSRSRMGPRFNPVAYHLRNLLTIDSLGQTLAVWRAWRGGKTQAEWVDGFKLRHNPPRRPDLRGDILWSMNFYLKSPTAFPSFKSFSQSMERLRSIVRLCREKGVELTVVVLPVHALHLEVMRGAGMWDMFEAWQRDMAALLEAESTGTFRVPFWDFTRYLGAAAEAIPRAAGPAPSMKFFRDEAHALPSLVHLACRRVHGETVVDPMDRGEFGVLVDSDSVESHLKSLRAQREEYAATHPLEVEWVRNLSAAAAAWNARHPTR